MIKKLYNKIFKPDRIRPNDLVRITDNSRGYDIQVEGRIVEYTPDKIVLKLHAGFDARTVTIEKVTRRKQQ